MDSNEFERLTVTGVLPVKGTTRQSNPAQCAVKRQSGARSLWRRLSDKTQMLLRRFARSD